MQVDTYIEENRALVRIVTAEKEQKLIMFELIHYSFEPVHVHLFTPIARQQARMLLWVGKHWPLPSELVHRIISFVIPKTKSILIYTGQDLKPASMEDVAFTLSDEARNLFMSFLTVFGSQSREFLR